MPSTTAAPPARYVIIGAGVFGASTTHHLITKYPSADVTLVDRTPYPCPLAASWDWNKVVRANYGDLFYMSKALEAIHHWRTDPLYSPFYHESGLININNTGLGRRMVENYKTLGVQADVELIPPGDFKKLYYGGFYQNPDFQSVDEGFVNRNSGWGQAGGGGVTGAKTKTGEIIAGDRIILCTGAGTAKLLADSAPDRPELQVDGRMVAAAVVTGIVNLDPKQGGEKYTEIPVTVHTIKTTQGEVMPLTAPLTSPDPYTIKFCSDESFKNTCKHEASGQFFSIPPDTRDQDQRTPTQGLIDRLETVKRGILGVEAADKVKIDEYRVCWDAVTPNQDFIITSHLHCADLYVATAGSFHGWKFMPTIGRHVVELLDGELDADLVKRWAWDRENEGSAHGDLLPTLELRDL